jgi:hypothetical protein
MIFQGSNVGIVVVPAGLGSAIVDQFPRGGYTLLQVRIPFVPAIALHPSSCWSFSRVHPIPCSQISGNHP